VPATEITRVISEVTFPAYSKIQDESRLLQKAYLKVLQVTAFFSVPLAGIVVLQASELTRLFLGNKWLPQVPAMQVLAVWGLVRSIGGTTGPLFYSLGRPEFLTRLQLMQFLLLAALIYPLSVALGILGTSLAVVVAALIPNAIACFKAAQMVKARPGQFIQLIFFPLLAAVASYLVASGLRLLTAESLPLAVYFALELGLYLAVYFGISYLAERLLGCRTLTLLKETWQRYL
jgi:lipopolysaccharide exporter